MKKKILSIALVVALLAVMVGGTLAYFSAEDEVTNTFTVGSVKIEIFENGEATEEDTKELGVLTPVVNTQDPSQDESYKYKIVEVKNTGANEAYIRLHIAIPTKLIGYLHLDLNETGWTRQADSVAGEYTVFTYDYNEKVSSGNVTSQLLKGVYLGSNVDLWENAAGHMEFVLKENGTITDYSGFTSHKLNADGTYTSETVSILVAAQAIQAQGFENGATDALNNGFNGNPWA